MAQFYTYLISSLPVLQFGVKAPFSLHNFLQMCQELIPQKDFEILKRSNNFENLNEEQQTLKAWFIFELTLRNELVRIRAARKKTDPVKYLRAEGLSDNNLHNVAMAAHRHSSLLESEKILDLERWKKLDELSVGHYFDLDFLIIYTIKLQILIRWDNINKVDKKSVLNKTLESGSEVDLPTSDFVSKTLG